MICYTNTLPTYTVPGIQTVLSQLEISDHLFEIVCLLSELHHFLQPYPESARYLLSCFSGSVVRPHLLLQTRDHLLSHHRHILTHCQQPKKCV